MNSKDNLIRILGSCTLLISFLYVGAHSENLAENLVPEKPGTAPNYWCTWSVQNYMFGLGAAELDPIELEGERGLLHAKHAMNEKNVLSTEGWAASFFPRVRNDLYVVYDDGLFRDGSGSFLIDEQKFPSFAGLEPRERLRQLNERTRALGWRGAGLWCRGIATGDALPEKFVGWSQYAGITYWKIDGGDNGFAYIDVAKRFFPDLKLEHIAGAGPFNGNWGSGEVGRFGKYRSDSHEGACLEHSDVMRTYDVSPALSFATTLDRATEALRFENDRPVRALINVEDEVYLAATLGCTMGVMRHPLIGLRPEGDLDPFFNCPRQCKRRMDEVVRALRWQRLAEPFASLDKPNVGQDQRPVENRSQIDERILVDSWTFKRGETWMSEAIGKTIKQGAPARVSRGLALPEVHCDGEPPFVIAGRFPNGAIAVATQGRTSPGENWIYPPADVTVEAGTATGPIGIFGRFRTLTLRFAGDLSGARVFAQDLAGDVAEDITAEVSIKGGTLSLAGPVIERVGLSAVSKGDISDPGLVLVIRK